MLIERHRVQDCGAASRCYCALPQLSAARLLCDRWIGFAVLRIYLWEKHLWEILKLYGRIQSLLSSARSSSSRQLWRGAPSRALARETQCTTCIYMHRADTAPASSHSSSLGLPPPCPHRRLTHSVQYLNAVTRGERRPSSSACSQRASTHATLCGHWSQP